MDEIQSSYCHVSLLESASLIKALVQANICVLSAVRNQKVSPLAIVGVNDRETQDGSFTPFLQQCLSRENNKQFLANLSDLSMSAKFNELVQSHKIHHYVHVPLKFKNGAAALVSLFYQTAKDIDPAKINEVIELLQKIHLSPDSNLHKTLSQHIKHSYGFHNIVGQSSALQDIFDIINLVAKTNANVLIYGETGTGKELIARTIHEHSLRQQADFVPVDCVAMPATLLESELFGFEKGAFTGAVGRKYGLLEFANKGTLFLDEISDLDARLQVKLLRVLQERQFRRIGGKKLINVDMRVIAAMNKNPQKGLLTGRLRSELYYRLNVIPIYIPSLRKRKSDIPLLINHYLKKTISRNKLGVKEISPEALQLLINYKWPGNVRELQNIIERIALLTPGRVIMAKHLPPKINMVKNKLNDPVHNHPFNEARKKHLENFEKKYLHDLLKETNNNIPEAARISGMSERTIYRMIERYGKQLN
ncbi:MAG: sigma-54 interaction domain-containing protein [bacterium]